MKGFTPLLHLRLSTGTSWDLVGLSRPVCKRSIWRLRKSVCADTSGVLVARGQSVDVGIVEERVVTVPPGEGLWREDRRVTTPTPGIPLHALTHPLAYLGADAEVVVRDELWALSVASVHPAVEGAKGHAGESQRKGQEAPGVGWGSKGEDEREAILGLEV